jgi:putative endonuclease
VSGWHVYVLLNHAGIAYTGIALDVGDRLRKHNAGTGAKFTRGRGPWRLVLVEGPMTHGAALKREAAIKKDRRLKACLKTGSRQQDD